MVETERMRKKESLGTQMPGARDTGAGFYPLQVTVQLKSLPSSSLDLLLFIVFLLCTHTHTHTHRGVGIKSGSTET